MKKFLSRFEAPDATAATTFVTAAIGMVVAFHWLSRDQAEAGGASLPEISEALRCSPARVSQIVVAARAKAAASLDARRVGEGRTYDGATNRRPRAPYVAFDAPSSW